MITHARKGVLCLAVAALSLTASASADTTASSAGVVVESVEPRSAARAAGLEPGDVLSSWALAPDPVTAPDGAGDVIASPFDLLEIEIEQAPRGRLRITGRRRGELIDVEMPPGKWSMVVRPRLPDSVEAEYLAARAMVLAESGAGDRETGLHRWLDLVERLEATDRHDLASWLLYRIAQEYREDRRWEEALEVLRRAATLAESSDDELALLRLQETIAAVLTAARDLERAAQVGGDVVAARERLQPDSLALARSLNELAYIHWSAAKLDSAEALNRRSLEIRGRWCPRGTPMADSLWRRGMVLAHRGDYQAALESIDRAVEILDNLVPESLDIAKVLMWRGVVHRLLSDLESAESDLRRSIAIQEPAAPTLLLPSTLNQLGVVLRDGGDLDGAEPLCLRALEIQRRLDPGSPPLAVTLNSLGILAIQRGDLAGAQSYFEECLEIRRRLSPGGSLEAAVLGNLGVVAEERGDLAAAERYMVRALEIRQALSPDHADLAISFNNLGMLVAKRGKLDDAEDYFERSLEVARRAMPGGVDVAWALRHLAELAVTRGAYDKAADYLRESMEIHRKVNPASPEAARNLTSFGTLAWKQGRLKEAEEYFKRALEIQKALSPASLEVAGSLWHLGRLAYERDEPGRAEALLSRSLEIRNTLRPRSDDVAASAHALGLVYRATGRREQAVAAFREAIEAAESQRTRLGGSEITRAAWAGSTADYYHDLIDLLAAMGGTEQAFETVERSRARGLLNMLSQRDLLFSLEVPADLERRRQRADATYETIQAEMSDLDAETDRDRIEKLAADLRAVRREQERIASAIRESAPRLASLRDPRPLDLDGVRDALDAGTVLLSYSVGARRTWLFVVGPKSAGDGSTAPLSRFEIDVGRSQLRDRVQALRRAVSRPDEPESFRRLAAGLYDLLVKPAESLVAGGDRIVFSLDGALHTLPFAALVRRSSTGKPQYLVEWKPLHAVASITVYAEIKRGRDRSEPPPLMLAAFGNPSHPAKTGVAASSSEVVRGGLPLDPLPWSEYEVQRIAELYPDVSATYTGARATEARARTVAGKARYLHFACHSVLDERFPLDSALVLASSTDAEDGGGNGILQAWEIFEDVRIDADLVTLSACETALGEEIEGEGLIGLTRAFTYAGARSVLASLWSVSDRSTAELMSRFYGHLEDGAPKDEALRAAQLDLIHGGAASRAADDSGARRGVSRLAKGSAPPAGAAPFYWAAFELLGDWN